MSHDPNEQGISKLIQNIKNQLAGFKNIGKRRISVRISKTFFVLNMPFIPKQRMVYHP